jgi:hypothetical protein
MWLKNEELNHTESSCMIQFDIRYGIIIKVLADIESGTTDVRHLSEETVTS